MKMFMPLNWQFSDYYAIRLVDYLIDNPGKEISDEYAIEWCNARYYIKVMRRVCRTYGKGWYTPEQIKNFHKAIYKERREGKIFVSDYNIPVWKDYIERETYNRECKRDSILRQMKELGITYTLTHGRMGKRMIMDKDSYEKLVTIKEAEHSISLFKKRYVKGKLRYYVEAYFLDVRPIC